MGDRLSDILKRRKMGNLALDTLLERVRLPLVISDPTVADAPIIFANDAFLALTGFERSEVVGRNCRFLQGPATTEESLQQVRAIIASGDVGTVEIVNYRKDGSTFINALQIGPVKDDNGNTVLQFGSQLDVTAQRAAEDEAQRLARAEFLHRLRNVIGVMSSMIKLTSREFDDREAFVGAITGRLHALGEAHLRTLTDDLEARVFAATLTTAIVGHYAGGPMGQLKVTVAEDFGIGNRVVTPLALSLHELATNSVKYGAFGASGGTVDVQWSRDGDRATMTWQEAGGPMVQAPSQPGGSRIIARVLAGVGGEIDFDWNPEGLKVRLRLPVA
ncbi:MAG: histidine kinase [Rhodobacterales bacterium]|nr:MAG: histidine kinase [Rhodobacterales bacterium]